MNGEVYFPFFPSDWLRERALSLCSLAARGLWFEMILIMHDSERYGHLCIGSDPVAPAQLAEMVKSSEEEVVELLSELERRRIFSRAEDKTIFCRKMVRAATMGGFLASKHRRSRSTESVRDGSRARSDSDSGSDSDSSDLDQSKVGANEEPGGMKLGQAVDAVISHYVNETMAVHGLKKHEVRIPVGANRNFVKELLRYDVANLPQLLRDVSAFVRLDDNFLRKRAYPLHLLASRLGEIRMAAKPRAPLFQPAENPMPEPGLPSQESKP